MAERPNILLIMTDQHTPQVAGFAGDRYVRSSSAASVGRRSTKGWSLIDSASRNSSPASSPARRISTC